MKKWLLPGLLLVALTCAAAPALAAEQPDVVMGGKVILTFRAAAGGRTPLERAHILTQRCVDILSDPAVTEKDVKIVTPKRGAEPKIYAGSHLFVTVTRADAKVNEADMQTLAKKWAKNLHDAFAIARVHRPEEGNP